MTEYLPDYFFRLSFRVIRQIRHKEKNARAQLEGALFSTPAVTTASADFVCHRRE
jgi:hypothetical protein